MSATPNPDLRTGAQILCEALVRQGVDVIFGIPGGAIMPFYHALPEYSEQLHHVLCRHEQGAGHAAEGYARASGRVGVCVATSGPGATNLVTPIADAWMDSSPMVAITGQVSSALLGTDAFQETDIVGITVPITKHSYLVRDPREIPRVIAEAFYLASTGRPGPVLVDVTKDAQQASIVPDWNVTLDLAGYDDHRQCEVNAGAVREAAALLASSSRPLILVGNGVIQSGASAELLALAEYTGIPVITTLHGLGSFPQDHPLSLGMPGMHGWVHVNRAIQRCDVLLNVGSRFDDRVTGKASTFAPHAAVIHVDVDPSEIGKLVPVRVGIVGDARAALRALKNSRLETPTRRGPNSRIGPPGSRRCTRCATSSSRGRRIGVAQMTERSNRTTSAPHSTQHAERAATVASSRTSDSIRCGRLNCSTGTAHARTSRAADRAPWASPSPPRSVPPSHCLMRRSGWSSATADSR